MSGTGHGQALQAENEKQFVTILFVLCGFMETLYAEYKGLYIFWCLGRDTGSWRNTAVTQQLCSACYIFKV